MPLEMLQDDDRWIVIDTDDPPSADLTIFEGPTAQDRAEVFLAWMQNVTLDAHAMTWPERYAEDASLRIFVDAHACRDIVGFDTAMYNAAHYKQQAQEQADKAFRLEKELAVAQRQRDRR